ncbi:hypothetical protein [Campylobacter anatolicus]|uniref:hypothetical protein n=1 Tax=Campylobacter anatolicus TaxID=2829105 RepID=UPI002D21BAC4|nr:hypothetical protein [Campylobacter anatolicus]
MLKFVTSIFIAVFLNGCSSMFCSSCVALDGSHGISVSNADKMHFEEVLRIQSDCSMCSPSGSDLLINGSEYTSDVAIKCCLEKNMIDTNIGLKKVYFHRITDARNSARSIHFVSKKGKKEFFNSNPRLEVLFYLFLQQELNSRGIVVVDTQTSPYTYKLDFEFKFLEGKYSQTSEILNGRLDGDLRFHNINLNRNLSLSTRQQVRVLDAKESKDFDFFIALLVKQAAMKVADEISKL